MEHYILLLHFALAYAWKVPSIFHHISLKSYVTWPVKPPSLPPRNGCLVMDASMAHLSFCFVSLCGTNKQFQVIIVISLSALWIAPWS